MAYVTGTANSFTDLLTAVQNVCKANGWTQAGSVLSKGVCYMQLAVNGSYLQVVGGTGIGAGNALTGASTQPEGIGVLFNSGGNVDPFAFPMTYEVHVHTAPDEVYLVVNYGVSLYQWLGFGCSPAPGLPGTGNWYGASVNPVCNGLLSLTNANGGSYPFSPHPALFWNDAQYSGACGFVHHGLDGGAWSMGSNYSETYVSALGAANPLLSALPSAWNGETVLLPIAPVLPRSSGLVSQVAVLGHSRYARLDNYTPGSIITLGSNRWKTYPWYKLNASNRNGPNYNGTDTGTLGWALRYDGP